MNGTILFAWDYFHPLPKFLDDKLKRVGYLISTLDKLKHVGHLHVGHLIERQELDVAVCTLNRRFHHS